MLADVMQKAERMATLRLRTDKCNLVSPHKPFSVEVAREVNDAIDRCVPFFSSINIVESLKYLGLILGPAADVDTCWEAPATMVRARS
eukprot:5609915-Pyramimonas_sp.AAC.1